MTYEENTAQQTDDQETQGQTAPETPAESQIVPPEQTQTETPAPVTNADFAKRRLDQEKQRLREENEYLKDQLNFQQTQQHTQVKAPVVPGDADGLAENGPVNAGFQQLTQQVGNLKQDFSQMQHDRERNMRVTVDELGDKMFGDEFWYYRQFLTANERPTIEAHGYTDPKTAVEKIMSLGRLNAGNQAIPKNPPSQAQQDLNKINQNKQEPKSLNGVRNASAPSGAKKYEDYHDHGGDPGKQRKGRDAWKALAKDERDKIRDDFNRRMKG